MAIVRWIGAFGRGDSLEASLSFEIARSSAHEVCAEDTKNGSYISAKIGLLVKQTAVIRRFHGDVWSVTDEKTGRLVKTRNPVSTHSELWVNPIFTAIVVKNGVSDSNLKIARDFADAHGLKFLGITKKGRVFDM